MNYVKRRPKVSSGIERAPQREFPGHRQWVRGHNCYVPGCPSRAIEAAHVQDSDEVPPEERGGMALKAHDKWTFPCCHAHHLEAHAYGHDVFDKTHGVDRVKVALQMQKLSPHRFKWRTPT